MSSRKKQAKPDGFDVQDFLRSWATVQAKIGDLTPEQLMHALTVEKSQKNRPSIVARIATRYDNKLKQQRISELI